MSDLLGAVRRHRLALFALAMIVLVAWLLWAAIGALPSFFIGLALAFILDPAVTFLQRRGVPRWAGVLVTYAAVVAVVWLLLAYAVPPIARQTREFMAHLPELGATVAQIQQGIVDWYAGLPLPPELRVIIDEQVAASQSAIGEVVRALLAPTLNAIVRTATFVLGLIVIPVWLFFVLKDRERLPHAVASALPPTWRPDVENLLGLLARVGGRWVRGQLLLGASIFVLTAVLLTLLTFIGFGEFGEFTLVLALIAGVLEWFPIIGPIVAAVPALLIAISISPAATVAIVFVYVAIQQFENNFLVPKVMGDAIELNPAVMILSLVVGGALFGIGGAILAAPAVAAGRDLYRYGFHRLSGQPPAPAFELALHGGRPPEPDAGVEPVPAADTSAAPGPAADRTVQPEPEPEPEPESESEPAPKPARPSDRA